MTNQLDHELSIKKKLGIIQTQLKAPKNKYNKFGKYNYRNLEGIYEGVKPLLDRYACYLIIDNEMTVVGNKIFRKSIATLGCCVTDEEISATMYTQEAFDKPGMSPEQCSGSASSYGDKYALSRLFCLDDTNDPDSEYIEQASGVSDNPGEYVCMIGKKFNGKKVKDIPPKELTDYCKYLVKENPEMSGMMKSFVDNARKYLSTKG